MENYRAVRRVLWITLGLNLIATVAKLIIGYWTDSLSLIADGFDSVFDAASNVIGLVGIYVAARPADEDHPYGHRKAETVTALIISSLLFLTTWELIKSAVERLRDPALIQAEVNAWSFGALLVSILVHLTVVWYELRAGRRLRSDVLVADALHTRADIFVSLAVMGGLIAVWLGYPLADPILALVVALFIAKIGIDIIRESLPTLMDRVVMPPGKMEQVILAVPGVISCHGVRSRGHEGAVYVDLHIQVDPVMSIEQAHAIAHEVQHRLRERWPGVQDVTVHAEPAGSPPERARREAVVVQLRRIADELGVEVHDVWVYEAGESYYVEIHTEVDGTLSLREAHELVSSLEERVRANIPHLAEVIAHIEPHEGRSRVAGDDFGESDVVEAVRRVTAETLGADACHRIVAHRSVTGWSLSMHCTLPGDFSLSEAHQISSQIEVRLRGEIPGLERVVIHTEPRDGGEEP